jgi:hypothetical protein
MALPGLIFGSYLGTLGLRAREEALRPLWSDGVNRICNTNHPVLICRVGAPGSDADKLVTEGDLVLREKPLFIGPGSDRIIGRASR